MTAAIARLKALFDYVRGKRSELQQLKMRDVVMAKVILDIHRKKLQSQFVVVPLYAIKPLHRIDRESALAATEQRAEALRPHLQELRAASVVTRQALGTYLPSISWIKVVQDGPAAYISYEGNGRLEALRRVFTPEDQMQVEVELYTFRNTAKLVRRLRRVRRMNGLE